MNRLTVEKLRHLDALAKHRRHELDLLRRLTIEAAQPTVRAADTAPQPEPIPVSPEMRAIGWQLLKTMDIAEREARRHTERNAV